MLFRTLRSLGPGLLALSLASGCGGGGKDKPAVTIAVTPTTAMLPANGSMFFNAQVSGTPNMDVTWSVREGVSGGVVHQDGLYEAPAKGGTYHVVGTSQVDPTKASAATVTVVEAPTINSFTVTPGLITVGDSCDIKWSVTGAIETVTIDQGIGAVAFSGTHTVTPSANTTYWITVSGPGGTRSQGVTVGVVPPPRIYSFEALQTTVTPGSSALITPVFYDGKGMISPGLGIVTCWAQVNTQAMATDTTFTLTVTNDAGRQVSRALTVHVDPGTFSEAGPLNRSRGFATAFTLPDGRALILGGEAQNAPTTAEFFEPSAAGGHGAFIQAPGVIPSPGVTQFGSVLLADGSVLMVGGLDPNGPDNAGKAIYRFDPGTGNFTFLKTMTTGRIRPWVALLRDGRVLIAGGTGWDLNQPTVPLLDTAEIFDPVSNTLTPTMNLLGGQAAGFGYRPLPGLTLGDGTVLLAGGGNFKGVTGAERFDPAANSFALTGDASLGGYWWAQTLLADGRVLLAGTNMRDMGCALFDPVTGANTPTASQLLPLTEWPTATLMGDGRVLLAGIGGSQGSEVAVDAQIFDPATSSWKFTARYGKRWGQASTLLPSGRVLLAGGVNYDFFGYPNETSALLFDAGPAVPAPVPDATLTVLGTAMAGMAGLTASVPATPGAHYFWMIEGGIITGGLGTHAITFTAGNAGTLKVHCLVSSSLGISGQATAKVAVN